MGVPIAMAAFCAIFIISLGLDVWHQRRCIKALREERALLNKAQRRVRRAAEDAEKILTTMPDRMAEAAAEGAKRAGYSVHVICSAQDRAVVDKAFSEALRRLQRERRN